MFKGSASPYFFSKATSPSAGRFTPIVVTESFFMFDRGTMVLLHWFVKILLARTHGFTDVWLQYGLRNWNRNEK